MKNETIEIDGKSFELVPNKVGTIDPEVFFTEGYLLKPVEEKKEPVKAEEWWICKSGNAYNTKQFDPQDRPIVGQFKTVRPMKRGDVFNAIDGLAGHYSSIDEDEAINNILDRLEELGLIQGGES